jgi:hypothetical protein
MSWLTRIAHALRPQRLDEDLIDEINDHLTRRGKDLESRGVEPDARTVVRRARSGT